MKSTGIKRRVIASILSAVMITSVALTTAVSTCAYTDNNKKIVLCSDENRISAHTAISTGVNVAGTVFSTLASSFMGPVLGPAVGSFSSSLLSSFIDDIFSKKDTTPEQLINKIGELENNVEKNKKEEIDLLNKIDAEINLVRFTALKGALDRINSDNTISLKGIASQFSLVEPGRDNTRFYNKIMEYTINNDKYTDDMAIIKDYITGNNLREGDFKDFYEALLVHYQHSTDEFTKSNAKLVAFSEVCNVYRDCVIAYMTAYQSMIYGYTAQACYSEEANKPALAYNIVEDMEKLNKEGQEVSEGIKDYFSNVGAVSEIKNNSTNTSMFYFSTDETDCFKGMFKLVNTHKGENEDVKIDVFKRITCCSLELYDMKGNVRIDLHGNNIGYMCATGILVFRKMAKPVYVVSTDKNSSILAYNNIGIRNAFVLEDSHVFLDNISYTLGCSYYGNSSLECIKNCYCLDVIPD